MSISASALWGPQQLSSVASVVYRSTFVTVIKRAVFTNIDTAAHEITAYVVRAGGTPGASSIIIDGFTIVPNQAYIALELGNLVLSSGDSLQISCDSPAVVNTIGSGYIQQ